MRADRRAFTEFLEVVDNDKSAAREPALNNPAVAILRTKLHGIHMNRIVGGDGVNLLLTLKLGHCYLWDQNGIVKRLSLGFHAAKLPRSKNVAWIRE